MAGTRVSLTPSPTLRRSPTTNMRISAYHSTERQLTLWVPQLGNHGHVRTVVGDLVEDLSAEYLGGKRHRTQSSADYCPDVSRATPKGGTVGEQGRRGFEYFECKSVGKSKRAFVYAGRVEKDRTFSLLHPLYYVIWSHSAETKQAGSVPELETLVLAHVRKVLVVPFSSLDAIIRTLPVEPLNSGYGPAATRASPKIKKAYGSGYRISLSRLEAFVVETFPQGVSELVRASWRNRPALITKGGSL